MTEEVNELPVDVVEVKPAEKIKKKRRTPAEMKAARLATEKAKAESQEVSVEDTVIKWKYPHPLGRNKITGEVNYVQGEYKLGELFNELNSILSTRQARFTYQKEDNTIHVYGILGSINCYNIGMPRDKLISQVNAHTPLFQGIKGGVGTESLKDGNKYFQ